MAYSILVPLVMIFTEPGKYSSVFSHSKLIWVGREMIRIGRIVRAYFLSGGQNLATVAPEVCSGENNVPKKAKKQKIQKKLGREDKEIRKRRWSN